MSTQVQKSYGVWASTYDEDRNLTRDLDEQVVKETLGGLRCKSILEFGCGTGKNTALFAQIGDRVRALDFSEQMIERAKAKDPGNNVTFELANITQAWPCEDNSIDLVTCNLVLEHVEDISFVFSEAVRVLTDGGRFFVSELHPFRQYLGVQARFERNRETTKIDAFVHELTEFTDAAARNKLSLESLKEWRHEEDREKPPRLISFLFRKA